MIQRHDGRPCNQLRDISVLYNVFEYSPGSVLFEVGKTKVLCAVTLQYGLPPFLRGKQGGGWLTAEYAMLPAATVARTTREVTMMRRNGRSIEIGRLIGRALRVVVDLDVLGERTIFVDCDVLQADGGTRTASITGAYLALRMAQEQWLQDDIIRQPFLKNGLVAVSVGILDGQPVLDLDYYEDNKADADFNFMITHTGTIVEVQGGAEKTPVTAELFNSVCALGIEGARQLCELLDQNSTKLPEASRNKKHHGPENKRAPLFSLQNRKQLSSP